MSNLPFNSAPSFSKDDYKWMALAIQQANLARFWAKPNPNVGCVIVKDNQLLAKGCTQTPGHAHAEINALEQINFEATGTTCYVTLEPCAHTGRTGPCANALVKAGVSKVVIACLDSNPQVAGKGVSILQDAGIEVTWGLMAGEVTQQLAGFFSRMQTHKPWVTLKLACSLDGNIALKNGESKWITSSDSRRDVQVHRALSGCILTTSQTVIADNPSMNVRADEWPLEADFALQPLKAVLDASLKTSPTSTIYQNDTSNTLVFFNSNKTTDQRKQAFLDQGIELIETPIKNDQLDIESILIELGKREINDVWVECGATLAGHLIQNQLVDTFIMYQAPILLGANSINSMGFIIDHMPQAIKLQRSDIRQIGADVKMTFRFIQNTNVSTK
ncbi:bifunctional diaminohydroxyphosphoribosylaminopyrimidine deaminase/5-amino-6-(5-phosphoribosylamino)uracil reductase RibD [Marinicellulosiphila megalodicopiae]|uniref:bifunctional diaminohydroxyphosphoribosylaminopyrimidine deaminase/5-amino-6-(5-phosphoribosylamino)uracil reductase RibD n=1 Tax=Marinicellulosiphila megalodicopiae TaxID=2724896 RepID=UPI003BB060B8